MNKRGLSEVVTTLIMVLLALVAIGSVWVIVSNVLSSGSDSINLGKFTIDINFLRASLNGNDVVLTVKRTSGPGNLTGLKFIISDGFNSENFDIKTNLTELQEKTFMVTLSSLNSSNLKTASVAPVFASGGKETLGDITDTFNFLAGSSGGLGGIGDNGNNGNNGGGNNNQSGGNQSGQCIPACAASDTCVNGVCVPPSCQPQNQSLTCGSWVCGSKINNCGEAISCGTCTVSEMCNNNIGQCQVIEPILGTVYSSWNWVLFDSFDLPTDNVYAGYYAKFPDSNQEINCLQIEHYTLPQPPQIKVIVQLRPTAETNISANDSVQLWPTYGSCIA